MPTMEGRTSTPRSSSRSKRSTTNLSNLRLAPLSTKFITEPSDHAAVRSPYNEAAQAIYARQHSSYLQGRSAPTTPGILSRSSSRRQLHGGLSRRERMYDQDDSVREYQYDAVNKDQAGSLRVDVGSGQIPKAKSEAALSGAGRLSGQGVPLQRRQRHHGRSQTGTHTPRVTITKQQVPEDDWFTHARAATNALVQESKGQSWLASRDSSTALHLPDTDDDLDDNYEELAAMSVSQSRLQFADDELSPVGTRKSNWGSRYGSRSVSRRTSRRGSFVGVRTPLAGHVGQHDHAGYFDEESLQPDFVDVEDGAEGDEGDETVLSQLTQDHSFGLGGIVDRLMGFNLFNVEEREETTEDEEEEREVETEEEARERRAAENRRKREEKERLTMPPPAPSADDAAQGNVAWQDATWLLSVASKAMF